jgi:hypothetical protein
VDADGGLIQLTDSIRLLPAGAGHVLANHILLPHTGPLFSASAAPGTMSERLAAQVSDQQR